MSKEAVEGDLHESAKELYPTVIAPVKGKGTRLYPLTLDKSKTLIPVANRSILERTLENTASFGCRNFWIVGEYELYNYFRNGDVFSRRLSLSPSVAFNYTIEEDKGNADGVRIALEKRHVKTNEYKITGDVIIVSGDCVIDMDWERLMETYRKYDADMLIVLKEVEDVSNYGAARIEANRIVDFIEKPDPSEAPSNLVNTFVNVVTADKLRKVFDEMKQKKLEATDFGSHIIPYMTKNHVVRPYVNEGYWEDIGTPKTLLQANLAILQAKISGGNREPRIHSTSIHSIDHDVVLDNVIIGANVTIGSNCRLRNVCVDSNTTIDDDTLIEDSVIYFGARIGRGCRIIRSIIDRFGDTGEKTQVGDYEPDETTVVGAYTTLGESWYMWPGELTVKYSPEAREKIVNAKRHGTNLYKIISDDGENLYFVDRTILKKTYNDVPPLIFGKIKP
jgi:mannose-1-phosphate guanylyltransferase